VTTFAVLATGPSLTQEQVDAVRHLRVVAVSDAYRLAPWAEALVSQDAKWWRFHRPEFAGLKFCGAWEPPEGVQPVKGLPTGCNSGVLGIRVARLLGATRILLLGFDGHGSHFFGLHPAPLKNTDEVRRLAHIEQHRQEAHTCQWAKVEVVNCSPGTVLPYPVGELSAALCAPG
jgi:hypothetical protein